MRKISRTVRRIQVLIETYWNVNDAELTDYEIGDMVLIETYWNVNIIQKYTDGGVKKY